MIYTDRMEDAIHFSIEVHEEHQKQKRKGKDIPYITHPLTVGLILARAGADEDVVIAGILHDTIEDSVPHHKVTKEMLAERFGERVADLVFHVTEKTRTLSWHERKAAALAEIASFPPDALFVKSADLLSNHTELLRDHARDGDDTFHRFHTSKDAMMLHAIHTIDAVLAAWEPNPLRTDLEMVRTELERII